MKYFTAVATNVTFFLFRRFIISYLYPVLSRMNRGLLLIIVRHRCAFFSRVSLGWGICCCLGSCDFVCRLVFCCFFWRFCQFRQSFLISCGNILYPLVLVIGVSLMVGSWYSSWVFFLSRFGFMMICSWYVYCFSMMTSWVTGVCLLEVIFS